jgi:hypothetical protein
VITKNIGLSQMLIYKDLPAGGRFEQGAGPSA